MNPVRLLRCGVVVNVIGFVLAIYVLQLDANLVQYSGAPARAIELADRGVINTNVLTQQFPSFKENPTYWLGRWIASKERERISALGWFILGLATANGILALAVLRCVVMDPRFRDTK